MDRINAAFTYLLQGCHCVPAVGHPGGEVGGSRRFIVFICFCHKFWNCDLVRHYVSLYQYKKEDARSVIPLWRRWGFGRKSLQQQWECLWRSAGAEKHRVHVIPVFPKDRTGQRRHSFAALCYKVMGLRICPSWRPTHYSLTIQFYGMALRSRQKALLVWVLGALTVFPKLRRCVCKARPRPLTSGGTTSRRFQPERKKLTKVEEENGRTRISQ